MFLLTTFILDNIRTELDLLIPISVHSFFPFNGVFDSIVDKGEIADAMKSGFLLCDDDMRQGLFTSVISS